MCVLQVFQAPEFYMRGVTGAYAVTDLVNGTYPIGQALWSLVQGPKWEHWIFVMGEATEYGWVDSRLPIHTHSRLMTHNDSYIILHE